MEKERLLQELRAGYERGEITRDDLQALMSRDVHPEIANQKRGINIASVLYYVGAAIVLIGLVVFFVQQWDKLSSMLRILVTLGFGIAIFVSGIFLKQAKRFDRVPDAMQVIAGVLLPVGVFVTLYELGFRGGEWGPGLIFLFLTIAYAVVYVAYREVVFPLFAIIYGTCATFLLTTSLLGSAPIFDEMRFAMYRIFAVGVSYILLGYGFKVSPLVKLRTPLYSFGSLFVLVSGIFLGGWQPNQSVFWELIYPLVTFGGMYLALEIRSRIMLIFSAIGLIAYLIKITNEYFSDSLSWPLLLILCGAVIIGVGYLTYYLNSKYFGVKDGKGSTGQPMTP